MNGENECWKSVWKILTIETLSEIYNQVYKQYAAGNNVLHHQEEVRKEKGHKKERQEKYR